MEFRILGPLEVVDDGLTVDVGAAKQRALLACLLLEPNRVVSSDRLVEALWGSSAPETAGKALQVYVSSLRKVLGRERILTRAPGYQIRIGPGELDLGRFENLVSEGRLAEALRLWRGTPLADFAYEPFAQAEIARLEELRLACLEERIERDLARGRHGALVGELEALVHAHPLRERLRGQLMLALYRSGRQAEALEAYASGRALLADELGLEPSAELKRLQRSILEQDPALDLDGGPPTEEPSSAVSEEVERVALPVGREVRKTVTVLVCDVAAIERSLDPESLRHMLARGLELLVPVLEHHGATVERSIGGVVTAIFGIPIVHEDDALRAVRAVTEIRDRLGAVRGELEERWGASLDLRAGIATGGVVTGGGPGGPFATGAPVEAAFALHRGAVPGTVLLDEHTHRRVRGVVDAEVADGRATLHALRAPGAVFETRFDSPMVGRAREQRRLRDAFEQAIEGGSCQLFTILGAPGVGKSRLVREFVAEVQREALVARGRCLPYGEGITYWPVVEAVRDAAGLDETASSDESLRTLTDLLEGVEDAELIAHRLAEVLGLTHETVGAEEAFWAVRTFFETLARRRSLVLVFDDIHWGEPTFLDLIDHLADWTRDAPVLLLCLARPELLELRPSWGGGKLNSTTTLLEPLSETETDQLVANLTARVELDERDRRRIVEGAGGNPLFVEELLALVLDERDTELEVPPTIQALLAARLDRLTDEERLVIEAAAVEGKIFHEGSIVELVGLDDAEVHDHLLTLVRRELVRPDRSVFAGERGYQFRHLLIRDAAYDSLPKEARATLHERHAVWLEGKAGDRALEFEEILGYHLEQAFRYRAELGPMDQATQELAQQAGARLGTAGRRALTRGDVPAAINLLSRAASALVKDDPSRVHLVPTVRAVQGLGDRLGWAQAVIADALETEEPLLRAHARVQQALLDLFTQASVDVDDLVRVAEETLDVFDRHGDELGRARSWRLLQQARYLGRDAAASPDAAERALVHARAAGDWLEELETITWMGVALFMGATQVAEAAERVQALLAQTRGGRAVEALLLGPLAALRAMGGAPREARELLDQARGVVDDLGYLSQLAVIPFYVGQVERLAGAPETAERELRASLQPLEEMRETSTYCSIVATLAQVVYEQGRSAEAEDLTRVSERTSRLNDVHAQITWRSVRAKALARRGRFADAEALAREAISFASAGDFVNAHADAMVDLAEVLELAGRVQEGLPAVDEAIRLFERKGNVVSAGRARERLERLRMTG